MYILLISRGIPSAKDPQWGCFEFDQARALKNFGHKVVVLSVDQRLRFHRRKLGVTYEQREGIDCYNYCLLPKKFSNLFGFDLSTKISFIQYKYLLKKIIKEQGKPDVIYSHYLMLSFYALFLRKSFNIPLVSIEHWSELAKDKLIPEAETLGKLTYGGVDKLICVSYALKSMVKKHFNKDSDVVYNVVADNFCRATLNFKIENKLKFITIGSLIHRKGFDLLIDAFSKLNLSKDRWELVIIGKGEEFDNLRKRINYLGLQDNIYLLGQKTKEQIIELFKDSNIFVLSSRKETFGVVYAEAMMMGLPVIATICGGPEEFVRETDGLLVPVDDVDALADAIKYMFENYQSYDRAKIAEDCKNRFSPEVIARQLTDIFEKVVEEHKQKQLN